MSLFNAYKAIQWVPTTYSSILIIYAPSFILSGKLFLEQTPSNLSLFWWYFCKSIFAKGWGGI